MRIEHEPEKPHQKTGSSWAFKGETERGLQILLDKNGIVLMIDAEIDAFEGTAEQAKKEALRRFKLHRGPGSLRIKNLYYLEIEIKPEISSDIIKKIDRLRGFDD